MELDGHRGTFRYTLGRRYEFEDFHELKSGGIYMLQPATERLDLKTITGTRDAFPSSKIFIGYAVLKQRLIRSALCSSCHTGDRWRRFKLRIDPLLHFESMKAIDIMRRGRSCFIPIKRLFFQTAKYSSFWNTERSASNFKKLHLGLSPMYTMCLTIGTNLLRHSEQGYPHLRQFQLSSDCKRLLWYSAQDGGTTAGKRCAWWQGNPRCKNQL